jgi:hypothetical protein
MVGEKDSKELIIEFLVMAGMGCRAWTDVAELTDVIGGA